MSVMILMVVSSWWRSISLDMLLIFCVITETSQKLERITTGSVGNRLYLCCEESEISPSSVSQFLEFKLRNNKVNLSTGRNVPSEKVEFEVRGCFSVSLNVLIKIRRKSDIEHQTA